MLGLKKSFRDRIEKHLGENPSELPIITEDFADYNHANLHLALEEYTGDESRSSEIVGIQSGMNFMNFGGTSLSNLVSKKSIYSRLGLTGVKEGPVKRSTVTLEQGKTLRCIENALFIIGDDRKKIVALLKKQEFSFSSSSGITLEVMSTDQKHCEEFLEELNAIINRRNVYRGKLLSLAQSNSPSGAAAGVKILFHSIPPVTREQIILPSELLNRIERQTMDVVQYSQALMNAGQKLKRGILLYGQPGTGKTLSAKYLATQMTGRTILMLTGRSQGLIESSCEIARWLQPSMVVIEDVDLIAEDRNQNGECTTAVLFELLNQMDGLTDDSDVLFMLTTNRPDILEPALVSRPGRIDQAYEIPLPDLDCRRRLFKHYSEKLEIESDDIEIFARKTEGASGAFIAELIRKAALFAAPEGEPIKIEGKHLDEAMQELVFVGGDLTKRLLGFEVQEASD